MSSASGKTEGVLHVAQTEYISSFFMTVMKYLRPDTLEEKRIFFFSQFLDPESLVSLALALASVPQKYHLKVGSTKTTGV